MRRSGEEATKTLDGSWEARERERVLEEIFEEVGSQKVNKIK